MRPGTISINLKVLLFIPVFIFSVSHRAIAEEVVVGRKPVGVTTGWWCTSSQLSTFRLPPFASGTEILYIDIDGDGSPDVLRGILSDGTPVQWIDDNRNMRVGDMSGDNSDDCLMIDRNRDGLFGSYGDLVVDWVDTDNDGNPDLQIVVDNPPAPVESVWGGHYMIFFDLDRDNVFNYLDWNTYQVRCWTHYGVCDFYPDYIGHSMFLKAQGSPERMKDTRLNWENPFIFIDSDNDGLTEMTVRLRDTKVNSKIDWAAVSIDLDNDNTPYVPFSFDMTLGWRSSVGNDYSDCVHQIQNLRGLPAADVYFLDPRWRQNTELIFPDEKQSFALIESGKWDKCWFVFDEDGDCNRWERVEFYEPGDMYVTGPLNGGLDNNRQSDVIGDRGEWDEDNSGGGNLYVSPLDGKIHLFGAEWGAWRVDQRAECFQGMGGLYDIYGPGRLEKDPAPGFPVIRYDDCDGNGFFDKMSCDWNGDGVFDEIKTLEKGEDVSKVIETHGMRAKDYQRLFRRVARRDWRNASSMLRSAERKGLDTSWYALLKHPKSLRQKYDFSFWLQTYIEHDINSI